MPLLFALVFSLVPTLGGAQGRESAVWVLTIDRWGNAERQLLTVAGEDSTLAGTLGRWPLSGRRDGDSISFAFTDDRKATYRFRAAVAGESMSGFADYPDINDAERRVRHAFTAWRIPDRGGEASRRHAFEPSTFSNEFTAQRNPVLVIWPGDTVSTRTIDSGGADARGVTRALYGNPQTGPFFVATAQPGDVLAVHIRRLRLNRDYAESLDDIVGRALTPAMAARAGDLGQRVRWRLDRDRGVATLADAPRNLAEFTVPIRPMLGGLGVAPDFGFAPASGGDSGRFGGNMDWNELTEGTTLYLPVFQPGALLYLGDGHAAQGDGETTQWALETSLDVEFSVDVLPARPLATPRLVTPTHLMALGQAGSLDDALRAATSGITQWLQQDYGLTLSEVALVLGSAVEYRVVTLAGRNVGVSARLERSRLSRLPARTGALGSLPGPGKDGSR